MKKASRFMPKYPTEESSIFAWAFLGGFIISVFYLFYLTPILLLFIPFGFIYFYIDKTRTTKKFEKLAIDRKGLSICEFSRCFDMKTVDSWIVRAVYEQVQDYLPSKIPLKKDDNLFNLLEIDEDDLEFCLLNEISYRTGRSLEDLEQNKYSNNLKSLGDLVYLFNEQPKLKELNYNNETI